ncbi:RNA polymerase sigma factor [Pontiella desulfatans]|nr:RNA polymerase sigma factor [Pontiella desulfatans]
MRAKNQDDEAAWEEFVRYYREFFHMVLNQMGLLSADADDLVQEILIQIWKSLPNHIYDQDRAQFRTWLSRLIRNQVLNHVRTTKRRDRKHAAVAEQGEEDHIAVVTEPEVEQIIRKEWEIYIVQLAIENIKPLFSERSIKAFSMSIDGYDTAHIAEYLGVKPNSVVKLKSRVKARLVKEIHRLRNELEAL